MVDIGTVDFVPERYKWKLTEFTNRALDFPWLRKIPANAQIGDILDIIGSTRSSYHFYRWSIRDKMLPVHVPVEWQTFCEGISGHCWDLTATFWKSDVQAISWPVYVQSENVVSLWGYMLTYPLGNTCRGKMIHVCSYHEQGGDREHVLGLSLTRRARACVRACTETENIKIKTGSVLRACFEPCWQTGKIIHT
jgi:hypothetical protein